MKKYRKKLLSFLLSMVLVLLTSGCGGRFDAAGYTQALLHLTFQGETKEAMQVIKGADRNMLLLKYQESIDTFTTNVLTGQFEVSEARQLQFSELTAKIFSAMRYTVTGAEKTGKKEYEVSVTIEPADVFVNFGELLSEDSLKMAEDIKAGKYTGTEEEIDTQIMTDIVNHSYELLDAAYMRMDYGDSKTVILEVKADEDNEYAINEDDMNNLITKILRLDEM